MKFKSIVEFALWLWQGAISPPQLTVLKCLYGLPLERSERGLWRRFTGRGPFARYRPHEFDEGVLLLGRQSGKSSRLGVTVTLWESLCVERDIPAGEHLACLLFTPVLRQNTFNQCVDKLHSIPELESMIETDVSSAGEVRLTNGIDILGISSNPRFARGRTAILSVIDEAAYLSSDSEFVANLPELLESIRPSLVVRHGKLLLASSPAGKEGPLFEAWQNRADNPDVFVWRAPSDEMNPAIDRKLLERERKRGEAYYRREYLAEFVEARNPFLDPQAIDSAVFHGVSDLPAADSGTFAGLDLADRRDDCALAIAAPRNVGGKRRVVVLFAKTWKAGPRGHDVLRILHEMGETCQRYRVVRAKGDQKSMSVAESVLGRYGVRFERAVTFGNASERMFRTFSALLNAGDVALPDNAELLTQLRRLEERNTDAKRFRVQGRRGAKDDLAVSAVLAASMAANVLTSPEQHIETFHFDSSGREIGGGYVDEHGAVHGDGPESWWRPL